MQSLATTILKDSAVPKHKMLFNFLTYRMQEIEEERTADALSYSDDRGSNLIKSRGVSRFSKSSQITEQSSINGSSDFDNDVPRVPRQSCRVCLTTLNASAFRTGKGNAQ